MKVILFTAMMLVLWQAVATGQDIESKVDSVLRLMTLEEKVGQLNQYSSFWSTGPVSPETNKLKEIEAGHVGSLLNVKGFDKTRAMQEVAMRSRLRIPLLFGLDVIHGYKTTFPIPLAEAASWDLAAIETSARVAAVEAAASGVHWTFAPMVDVARDPRWGRVMEGAGEDTYLASLIAAARVKGFQGKKIGDLDAVLACAKHFAGYGAAVGGRDYNSVDMSERMLWEVYLPPFRAAAAAGAATFMNSFNDLNGVPATGSAYLQRDILKNKWQFKGFVVSDWGSIGEMIPHGYAADARDAAMKAITAGSDMDMESRSYTNHLSGLVKDGQVEGALLDDAVRRVLRKKFELGLFNDPFRFSNEQRQKQALSNPAHRKIAREMARKSIVLLKNENTLLPLSKGMKKIAVIGPLAKSESDMLGAWNVPWDDNSDVVTVYEGLASRFGKTATLLYAKGCNIDDSLQREFDEAVKIAEQSDVVIMVIGESGEMSGEAKSRASLQLPGMQEALVKRIHATGKPVVVIINAGRPLVFNWTADHVPAIVYAWWLGSEAGNAIADVLAGDYNPSGKLPMTFPRSEGQVPIYYNYYNTGRPAADDDSHAPYRSGYIDLAKTPRYSFGYGLSYTTFRYSELMLTDTVMQQEGNITLSVNITNTGKVAGEEVVQLYLRDRVASLVRPMKELKGFEKIYLNPGETRTVRFTIDAEKISFYNNKLEWISEPGWFDVMVGSSSSDIRLRTAIELK